MDSEVSDDQMESRVPLLSINDDEGNIRLTTTKPNRRSSSVSRVPIPDDAPATLSFHELNYVIGNEVDSNERRMNGLSLPFFKSKNYKQILFNVSGRFKNGMNAILGKIYFTLYSLSINI